APPPVVADPSPAVGKPAAKKPYVPPEVDDKVIEQIASMKVKPTDVSDFFDRWHLLDDWVVQLLHQKRPVPFTRAGLAELRAAFYADQRSAFERLDLLLRQADDYYVDHP